MHIHLSHVVMLAVHHALVEDIVLDIKCMHPGGSITCTSRRVMLLVMLGAQFGFVEDIVLGTEGMSPDGTADHTTFTSI
jgi:hypothetical protein